MESLSSDHGLILKTRNRAECMELRLVLEASGIGAIARHQRGWWLLVVDPSDLPAAMQELEEYRQENASRSTAVASAVPVYGGSGVGVAVYATIILMVGLASMPWGLALDLFTPGEMQAGKVMSGELWRVVTALSLHLDEGHLASNLLFGVLFGLLAGRTLGGGVAWLSIVTAGSLGNFVNACVQNPDHTSIGASTAVFAALGVLVADALRPRTSTQQSLLRRWTPLVGGIMLLAFIGVGGGRVDVIAHVTGFLSGVLIGWGSSRLPQSWLADSRVQFITGTIAVALIALAWVVAMNGKFQI